MVRHNDNDCQRQIMALVRRRTLLRIVVAAGIGLVVTYGACLYYFWLTSNQEEQLAIAEADRLDPGWRLVELEQKREVIPAEQNGSIMFLAAAKLWPAQQRFTEQAFWVEGGMEPSIVDLVPEIQLNAEQRR